MRYAARRTLYLAFIVVVVTFLVSAMLDFMPGDPAVAILGDNSSEEQRAVVRDRLNLDEPVVGRWYEWLRDAAQGDLGTSLANNERMTDVIRERMSVTLELVIGAQLLALLFAIPTAVVGAYRSGRSVDRVTSTISFGMLSVPSFVLGPVLILIFAVHLGWLPVAGYATFADDPAQNLRSMILPMITVASVPAAVYQRLLRNDIEATLKEDYILMAEAKGLSAPRILFRHALRPSTFSLITLIGMSTAQLIGGSIIVETIFSLPGLGRQLVSAIVRHDMVAVQAMVAVTAVVYVVLNGLVDVCYGFLDPRIRRGRG